MKVKLKTGTHTHLPYPIGSLHVGAALLPCNWYTTGTNELVSFDKKTNLSVPAPMLAVLESHLPVDPATPPPTSPRGLRRSQRAPTARRAAASKEGSPVSRESAPNSTRKVPAAAEQVSLVSPVKSRAFLNLCIFERTGEGLEGC